MGSSTPAGGASGPSSRASSALHARSDNFLQKRAKMHAARSIPVQQADDALKDGQLDLQAFVAAHDFEIRSLEQSMATSKAVSSSRAFQQVPRGLRRRTASHNPKRVPKRLRARAQREMADDNTPLVQARRRKPKTTRGRIRVETAKRLRLLSARKKKKTEALAAVSEGDGAKKNGQEKPEATGVVGRKPRPKIRRNQLNEPPKPPAKFRKRQMNKTWLPTHPWHAKRARMTEPKNPLWRFAIPLTPNEKIYRPMHRAQGERGAAVWDMSYMSTIGLYGTRTGMERVLKKIGVSAESCWNDKGKKWRLGSRSWTGFLSKETSDIRRDMCPGTIFWNPEPPANESTEYAPKKTQRQVYLRVHPSAFLELFNELLRLTKMENPRMYVEDLRFEIGTIELTGPASTEALLAILTPHGINGNATMKQIFQSLRGLTNSASLPANAMLGFSVQDPRLRYPPRKTEFPVDSKAQMHLLEVMAKWPAEDGLEPYGLFDRDVRHKASCLPSQKAINRRKSMSGPGFLLKPTSADPPIPIILLASRSGTDTQTQGSWTILAPWKCILPLWYSVVHVPLISGMNPRFAGLNESMQVAFERGVPWFPADFPGTQAGADWEAEQRKKRRWAYGRRPKSKRMEWHTLDLGGGRKGEVGDGLACDFEMLFGLPKPAEEKEEKGEEEEESAEGDQQGDDMDVDEEATATKAQADPPSLRLLNSISKGTFNSHLSTSSPHSPLPANAIINVRISLLSRGVVNPCARIYRLPLKPIPSPTSSNAEVPATIPPDETSVRLPNDLRAQWLACQPSPSPSSTRSKNKSNKSNPKDIETRTRLLAQELVAPPPPTQQHHDSHPARQPNQDDVGGHPLVPDARDLIGFVTTGCFNLAVGRGAAMGSLAVEKVLQGVRADAREGRLCIVRNAGENVGWLARWDVNV